MLLGGALFFGCVILGMVLQHPVTMGSLAGVLALWSGLRLAGKLPMPFVSRPGWVLTASLVALFFAASAGLSKYQSAQDREREQVAAQAAEEQRLTAVTEAAVAQEQEAQRLRQEAAQSVSQLEQDAAELEAALADPPYDDARAAADRSEALRARYRNVADLPSAAVAAMARWDDAVLQLERIERAPGVVANIIELVRQADSAARRAPIEADAGYEGALLLAEGLEDLPAALLRELRVPSRAHIERKRARIAGAVSRAREARARAEQEAVALREVCGAEPPTRSPWDGELVGSERYVARSAHDPDSIDVENCSAPVLTRACWVSTCDVRGKNAFGGMVLNQMRFNVGRNGQILGAENVR